MKKHISYKEAQESICHDFGAQIRILRLKAGYSQDEFSGICDLDRTYIGGIERGERNPTLKNIFKIACALGIQVSEIFERIERSRERNERIGVNEYMAVREKKDTE